MKERRKASRFQLFQLVKVEFGKEQHLWTEGIDISENGILCETESGCLEKGERVRLLFSMDGGDPVEAEGIVIRSDYDNPNDRCYIGVEFLDLDPGIQKAICSYVDDNLIEM